MDEPVRLADAPAIRKISEDCENRVFQQNLPGADVRQGHRIWTLALDSLDLGTVSSVIETCESAYDCIRIISDHEGSHTILSFSHL
jgi:hypothetical protein